MIEAQRPHQQKYPSRLLPVQNYQKKQTRTRCEICSKLAIKTQKLGYWCCSGVFIGTFEYIAQLVLMFILLTLIGKYRLRLYKFKKFLLPLQCRTNS